MYFPIRPQVTYIAQLSLYYMALVVQWYSACAWDVYWSRSWSNGSIPSKCNCNISFYFTFTFYFEVLLDAQVIFCFWKYTSPLWFIQQKVLLTLLAWLRMIDLVTRSLVVSISRVDSCEGWNPMCTFSTTHAYSLSLILDMALKPCMNSMRFPSFLIHSTDSDCYETFIISSPRVATCDLYAFGFHPLCLMPYALSFHPMLISWPYLYRHRWHHMLTHSVPGTLPDLCLLIHYSSMTSSAAP